MPVISVDGSSATGKSTAAACLSQLLPSSVIDTGEILRRLTAQVLALRISPTSPDVVLPVLRWPGPDIPSGHELRTRAVEATVAIVSAQPSVQYELALRLRRMVNSSDLFIVTGRSIGTSVFPDACLKVYLTASPEVRALRKATQLQISIDDARDLIGSRDALDATRSVNALREPHKALHIDTTDQTAAETAKTIAAAYEGDEITL